MDQQNQVTPNDPWSVKASGIEPVPNALYMATFKEVLPYSNERVQDKWRWVWAITNGQYQGREVTALTDQVIKATTLPGRLISGMAGRELRDGENVKALVEGFVGKAYMVRVSPGPKGGKAQVQSADLPPKQ